MLLPRSTKDQLLLKINEILENVSDVVKVLSSCQESSQEDVMPVSSQSQEDYHQQQDLWWDESESVTKLVSPVDSAIYTLSFLSNDLADVGELSLEEDSMEDDVFSNPSLKQEESSSHESLSSQTTTDSSEGSQASLVIDQLISFVEAAAPGAVYNAAKAKRRKRKKCDKFVVPELRHIWRNIASIFASPKPRTQGPHQPSYTLDWSSVNVRSVANLPQPKMFPKLGCSQDPDFYDESKRMVETGEYRWIDYEYPIVQRRESAFAHNRVTTKITGQNYPIYFPNHYNSEVKYGEESGYMTDVGVIPVKDDVFHGHVFDISSKKWVLHAKKQDGFKEKYKKRGAKARPRHQEFPQPQDARMPFKKGFPRKME